MELPIQLSWHKAVLMFFCVTDVALALIPLSRKKAPRSFLQALCSQSSSVRNLRKGCGKLFDIIPAWGSSCPSSWAQVVGRQDVVDWAGLHKARLGGLPSLQMACGTTETSKASPTPRRGTAGWAQPPPFPGCFLINVDQLVQGYEASGSTQHHVDPPLQGYSSPQLGAPVCVTHREPHPCLDDKLLCDGCPGC